MRIVFANNQTQQCFASESATVLFTDPVPLNGEDYLAISLLTHYIRPSTGPTMTFSAEIEESNDGQHWATLGVALKCEAAGEGTTPVFDAGAVRAAFIRGVFTFSATGGTGGEACAIGYDFVGNASKE